MSSTLISSLVLPILLCATSVLGQVSVCTLVYEDGSNFTTYTQQAALQEQNMFDRCQQGIWIYYGGFGFTSGFEDYGFGYIMIDVGETECGLFWGEMWTYRSVRAAGDMDNYTQPSSTFYTDVDHVGNDHLVLTGNTNIDYTIGSVIFIWTEIEFFNDYNYSGDSFCMTRSEYCIWEEFCIISEFNDYDLPFSISTAKSTRLGCSAKAMSRIPAKKSSLLLTKT